MYINTHICIYICMYTYVCIYIYVYIYLCIYTYIDIYIYVYMYVCIYINVYTYIHFPLSLSRSLPREYIRNANNLLSALVLGKCTHSQKSSAESFSVANSAANWVLRIFTGEKACHATVKREFAARVAICNVS